MYTHKETPVISPMPQPITITRKQWRWWFAGQAMVGGLAGRATGAAFDKDMAASVAVIFADALLAELERTSP